MSEGPHPGSGHPVEELFARLRNFGTYPDNVVRIAGRVGREGFFPGGSGLWGAKRGQPLPPMPIGEVMVLGHNLDSETTFGAAIADDGEDLNAATWREVRQKILPRLGIPLQKCFFTNFFMGLIEGKISTG